MHPDAILWRFGFVSQRNSPCINVNALDPQLRRNDDARASSVNKQSRKKKKNH
jgi:hypothetical protein